MFSTTLFGFVFVCVFTDTLFGLYQSQHHNHKKQPVVRVCVVTIVLSARFPVVE